MFFEDITIQKREQIRQWLDQKTSGELIFDDRPFVYYNVRPTKTVTGKLYISRHDGVSTDTYSGTFTVTFTAYEPFGYQKYKYYTGLDEDGASRYCGMLEENEMPPQPETTDTEFLLYNCGTEPCHTKITIAGEADDGLMIHNKTNGTWCKITSLPETGSLVIDSRLGSVSVINNGTETLDFQYHDEGFQKLEPAGVIMEDIWLTTEANSASATIENKPNNKNVAGSYILIDGEWVKIVAEDETGITLESEAESSGVSMTKIVPMNEIEITGTSVSQTALNIDYFPMIV